MISAKPRITVQLIFLVFPDELLHIRRARPLNIAPTISSIHAEVERMKEQHLCPREGHGERIEPEHLRGIIMLIDYAIQSVPNFLDIDHCRRSGFFHCRSCCSGYDPTKEIYRPLLFARSPLPLRSFYPEEVLSADPVLK